MWYLEMQALGCTAEIFLNGIPVVRVGAHAAFGSYHATPAQHCLIDGINHVSVQRVPEHPVHDHAQINIRLARYIIDNPQEPPTLGSSSAFVPLGVHWKRQDNPNEEPPEVWQAAAELGEQGGLWRWQTDADELTLDDATTQAVHQQIDRIRDGWRRGDASPFVHMLQHRLDDCLRAYPQSHESMFGFRAWLRAMACEPDWQVIDVPITDYALRLCANGKMVDCITRTGEPVIRNMPMEDGGTMEFPIKLARMAGHWVIAR